MPLLTVAPSPVVPATTAAVTGSGFPPASRIALRLDGVGVSTNVFRAKRDGTFSVGMTVGGTTKTQRLEALVGGVVVASTDVVVGSAPVPVPPAPRRALTLPSRLPMLGGA